MRILLFFLLFLCHTALAQSWEKDTAKVNSLNNLGYAAQWDNPRKAIDYCLPSLSLAQKIHYKAGESKALFIIGEALAVSGNYTKATELKFKLLEEAEKLGDKIEIGGAYMAIASGFFYQGEYEEMIHYTRKAIAVPGFYELAPLQLNGFLAEAYYKLSQPDSALPYAQKAYEIDVKRTGYHWSVPYYTLAAIHQTQKHYSLALDFYRLGLSFQPPGKDILDGHLGLATVFYEMGLTDSSLMYARRTILEGKALSFQAEVLDAAALAVKIFRNRGEQDSVAAYGELVMAAKDSLFSQEKVRAVQNLVYSEQLRQQELAAKKIREEEDRQRNLQYASIALGTLSLLILFFVFSHSVIASPYLIKFMGILSLLIVFEYINLLIHPYIAELTHHSPVWMLLIMVGIAALLIPLHHRIEYWVTHRLVEKNNNIRLQAAKRTIQELEGGLQPVPVQRKKSRGHSK